MKHIRLAIGMVFLSFVLNACNTDIDETSIEDVDTAITLTYWLAVDNMVYNAHTTLNETFYAAEQKRLTGIDIEYRHPAYAQEIEQFNLMIASGEYPDIIEYNFFREYSGGPVKAIEDGVILDLTDLIPGYAPNFHAYLNEHPEVRKMIMTDDGRIFNFPFIRSDESLLTFFGPIVNKSMLDDYGLELPETMNDWYVMLKTMKENGVENPLTYSLFMQDAWLGSCFVGAFDIANGFYQEDGQVKFGPIEATYKDYLIEMRRWYDEGLIDTDIASISKEQIRRKLITGTSGASIGYNASRLGSWIADTEGDDAYDFVGVKYPVLIEGQRPMFGQRDLVYTGEGAAISTSCQDIELAMKLLDFNYSEEGYLLNNYGVEGESYEIVAGVPILLESVINHESYDTSTSLTRYVRSTYRGPFVQSSNFYRQYGYSYPQQIQAVERWSDSDASLYSLPLITPSVEESEELARIMSGIDAYVDEMFLKFMFGIEPIDNYETYVQVITDMGINRAKEIYQDSLERYNKRE